MAGNTIMTAKNSFQEGLIMDFAPDNTQANCLTSALNATLLTFNGNEMSLQNDMGNGRVETAYLPEGYVPVGTCEFGDIIYIVSYNPLIDKAQIGCFPSPERNISSEELHNPDVTLAASDFQKLDDNGEPTGELKTSSIKKILFQNDLHPGDKYIVYAKDIDQTEVIETLSDNGNTDHVIGEFPKFVKIRIVSIEESGKMIYIDSNTKWYDNHYYIQSGIEGNDTLEPDIDSYRSLVSSAYNTFASKVSGKLALLIELEKITGFSHSWEVYETKKGDDNTYNVYFNFSWTTDSIYINPSAVCLTDSYWTKETNDKNSFNYYIINQGEKQSDSWTVGNNPEETIEITRLYMPEGDASTFSLRSTSVPQSYESVKNIYSNIDVKEVKDDVKNNLYNQPITKLFWDSLKIPVKRNDYDVDLTEAVYNYEITPAMPYGYLREFSQKGQIDFSKIGKEHIKLHTWKYYNTADTCTLTWGMDAYTSPGKVVSKVVFSFYDDKGLVATLTSDNKRSYNGIFTEYFNFNSEGSHPKLKNIERENDQNKKEKALILSNSLYLVKIDIYQSFKQADETLQETDETDETRTKYRWFWTNGVFNKYYNQVSDFDVLDLVLDLDFDVSFGSNANWQMTTTNRSCPETDPTDYNALYKTLCVNEQKVSGNDNISMKITPKLLNTFGTFNIDESKFEAEVGFANKKVVNYPEQPQSENSDENIVSTVGYLTPIVNSESFNTNQLPSIWGQEDSYLSYKNDFQLYVKEGTYVNRNNYIDSDGNPIEQLNMYEFIHLDDIKLTFNASHYSKYHKFIEMQQESSPALKPVVYDMTDLARYGIALDEDHNDIYFNKIYFSSTDNFYESGGNDMAFSATISNLGYGNYPENADDVSQASYTIESNSFEQAFKITQGNHNHFDLNTKVKSYLKDEFSFFVPYCVGFNNFALDNDISEDKNFSERRITDVTIRTKDAVDIKTKNTDCEVNDIKESGSLGGMLALKDPYGNLRVLDNATTCIHYYARDLLSILTQLYILSDEQYEYEAPYISNLQYLQPNYTKYTSDVIIQLFAQDKTVYINNSQELSEYYNAILESLKKSLKLQNQPEINTANVSLKEYNSMMKPVPISFVINYIIPTGEFIQNPNKTKVLGKDLTVSGNFMKNGIYLYDGSNFTNLKNIEDDYRIRRINGISREDTVIRPTFSNSDNYLSTSVSLNAFKNKLEVQNGMLAFNTSFVKPDTTNTYSFATCTKRPDDKNPYYIQGFEKDINFDTII